MEAAELLQEVIRRFDELPDDLESKAEWLTLRPKAMKAFALVVERALDETPCD